jgi:hypothetical protein
VEEKLDVHSWMSAVPDRSEPEIDYDDRNVEERAAELACGVPGMESESQLSKALLANVEQALLYLLDKQNFKWLLRRIRHSATFIEPGADGFSIHEQVLNLPYRPNSDLFIKLDWQPVKFLRSQYASTKMTSISTCITYIGSGLQVEVVGCETYVERTWRTYGTFVLETINRAIHAALDDVNGWLTHQSGCKGYNANRCQTPLLLSRSTGRCSWTSVLTREEQVFGPEVMSWQSKRR